jgi:hypothetical protein
MLKDGGNEGADLDCHIFWYLHPVFETVKKIKMSSLTMAIETSIQF